MTNILETIGALIEKQDICFISSVDENGFPTQRQCCRLLKRKA
jgi:general stress protein 26